MRLLLLTAFVFLCAATNATNYYFSFSSGIDSRSTTEAQHPSTPWKSLAKLNAVFPFLLPGDSVFLARGDVFEGSLTASRSGVAGSPIVIAAYGTGARPVISGMTFLSGFAEHNSNVWKIQWDAKRPAIVLLNDKQQPVGRFPNASAPNGGFLTFELSSAGTSITDNELPLNSNWTGADVVIRKNRWILDRCPITSQAGRTIYYANTSQYDAAKGFGYFIQNHLSALDQNGEWAYNQNGRQLYLYKENFNETTDIVEASVQETLLTISRQSHLSITGIHFKGANENGILLHLSKNISIDDCAFTYTGLNAVSLLTSTDVLIERSVFDYSNNNAITTSYHCNNVTVRHNIITNTGIFPGLGKSGDLGYQAITVKGKNNTVSYNKIESTGYVPIRFEGDYCTVQNNFIDKFCFIKDDGAGIYTWNNDAKAPENYGRVIKDNIVINGLGAAAGTTYPGNAHAHGIYLDDNSANVEITGNTVADCGESGIYIHNSRKTLVRNNTLYNNARQAFLQHDYISNNPVREVEIKNNILFSKKGTQHVLYFRTVKDDIALFGTADSNYYSRPFNQTPSIYTSYTKNYLEFVHSYDLATWKGAFQTDANTKGSPLEVPQYVNHGLIGANRISNGTFDKDIFSAYGFGLSGSFKMEWNKGGKLDGGSLQATMDAANTRGFVIMDVGSVVAGKAYLLKFSLLGESNHKSLAIFLRRKTAPFNRISDVSFSKVLNSRTENEVLFIPSESMSAASIVFDVSDQENLWMDNVQLFEANVSLPTPDEHVRFEYNATDASRFITLDALYVDVANKPYSGTVELAPYTSLVLLKKGASVKQEQAITFPPVAGKKFGDAPFALNATASSGLPVSYKITSGPASVAAGKLTISGAGTIVIEASQAGDAVYNAAATVTQEITAAKSEQTIDFAPLPGKTEGDAPFALSAKATSHLPVTFTIISGPATLANGLVTVTGAGPVVIAASQEGNKNYLPAQVVEQQFTVSEKAVAKRKQTIEFDAITEKEIRVETFELKADASSGLPVSFRVVSGPATITGNTVKLTGTGVVTIEAFQEGNDVYDPATPVTRSFNVTRYQNKRNQSISFGTLPYKTYTSLPFSLSATASSGLPVFFRVVSGPATVAGDMITITGVGQVTIEASQAGDEEYQPAAPVLRSFTVGKASQYITFPPLPNKTVGDAPFALSATASSGLPVTYRVVGGPATVTNGVVTITGAGIVLIEASQAGDENYQGTFPLYRGFVVTGGAVEKQAQSITFPVPANKSIGDEPFKLKATASSDLPVSYRVVSGPATVAGKMLTITGAGTVVVEATQAGNETFAEATPVTISFTVEKNGQSITFGTLIYRFYGDAPFALSATASSGLPVSYRIVGGPATVAGDMVTVTGVGQVTIEASQAGDEEYQPAAPVLRSFTVGKASQYITFPPLPNKTVGDAPFALSATASSGLPVAYRVVGGPATVTDGVVTITSAGIVLIEASQAGNENFVAANGVTRILLVALAPFTAAGDVTTTLPTPGNRNDQPAFNRMQVLPNPITTTGKIEIHVAKTGTASIAVYDKQGRLVKQLANRRFEKGQRTIVAIDMTGFASGTYLLRFTSTSGIMMWQKLQVIR